MIGLGNATQGSTRRPAPGPASPGPGAGRRVGPSFECEQVPNLDFYASGQDHRDILDFVFSSGEFRVFELTSRPDRTIEEFTQVDRVLSHYAEGESLLLQLLPIHSQGTAIFRKHSLNPGALGSATFRYLCEGWGLIQLYLESPRQNQLRPSHTNHNSPARALRWAPTYPHLGDPTVWQWPEVVRSSRRLVRGISRLAVNKRGSRPILEHAELSGAQFLPH